MHPKNEAAEKCIPLRPEMKQRTPSPSESDTVLAKRINQAAQQESYEKKFK